MRLCRFQQWRILNCHSKKKKISFSFVGYYYGKKIQWGKFYLSVLCKNQQIWRILYFWSMQLDKGVTSAMWKFSHVVLGIDLWCFCGLCCYGWKSSTEWGPGRGAVVLSPHALYLTFRWLQRSVWSNPQRYQCVPVSRHCSQTYLRTHQTARAPEIPHPPHLPPLSGHHTM